MHVGGYRDPQGTPFVALIDAYVIGQRAVILFAASHYDPLGDVRCFVGAPPPPLGGNVVFGGGGGGGGGGSGGWSMAKASCKGGAAWMSAWEHDQQCSVVCPVGDPANAALVTVASANATRQWRFSAVPKGASPPPAAAAAAAVGVAAGCPRGAPAAGALVGVMANRLHGRLNAAWLVDFMAHHAALGFGRIHVFGRHADLSADVNAVLRVLEADCRLVFHEVPRVLDLHVVRALVWESFSLGMRGSSRPNYC